MYTEFWNACNHVQGPGRCPVENSWPLHMSKRNLCPGRVQHLLVHLFMCFLQMSIIAGWRLQAADSETGVSVQFRKVHPRDECLWDQEQGSRVAKEEVELGCRCSQPYRALEWCSESSWVGLRGLGFCNPTAISYWMGGLFGNDHDLGLGSSLQLKPP